MQSSLSNVSPARRLPVQGTPTPSAVTAIGTAAHGHVLIIGDHTLDLICALIREGCPGVTAVRATDRVTSSHAETVLIPDAGSLFEAEQAIAHAVRALTPAGQIFIRIGSAPFEQPVREIERLLRAHGFSGIRLKIGDGVMVRAELPMFGPLV